MLLKLQQTRFSSNWMVFENISNVSYRANPHMFSSAEEFEGLRNSELLTHEHNIPQVDGFPHALGVEANAWYLLNEIKFFDGESYREILFDGEAYLCTDDCRTVHKFTRGGILIGGAKDYDSPPAVTGETE